MVPFPGDSVIRSKVLELVELSLFIIKEGPCDQNFISQGQSAFLPDEDIGVNMETTWGLEEMQCL